MAQVRKSSSRGAIGFGAVVLVHLVIIYGVQHGLARFVVDMVNGPMEAKLVEETKPDKEAPPPPPPKFQALPPPVIIPLDVQVEAAPVETTNTISTNSNVKAAAPPVEKPVSLPTVPPRSNPRRPVTQPEYPPTSKRLGEAGTVVMLLTVEEDGHISDAKIDKSSGFERLDDAALKEATRNWHLLPGTIGGKPTKMQYRFAVTFKITD